MRFRRVLALIGPALVVAACAAPVAAPEAPPGTTRAAPEAPPGTPHTAPDSIPFVAASVAQTAPGAFTVTWDAPDAGRVEVYAGTDRDRIGRDRVVATDDPASPAAPAATPATSPAAPAATPAAPAATPAAPATTPAAPAPPAATPATTPAAPATTTATQRTAQVTGLPPADRWWFELVPERGRPLVLADRSLHLTGAPNFRDLGGYRTADGRWVRMGALYRSDQLDRLTPEDSAKLDRLGLRTVVDLRTDTERTAGPDRVPAGARPVVADVLAGTPIPADLKALLTSPGDPTRTMRDLERAMVESPAAQAAYRSLLTEITRPDAAPLVFHCTAGKDRSGWAAATVLTAVGVPPAGVLADYLDSNRYVLPKYAPLVASLPAEQRARAQALVEVRPEYLQAGLDAAGPLPDYVARVLGVPLEQLRHRLLEP